MATIRFGDTAGDRWTEHHISGTVYVVRSPSGSTDAQQEALALALPDALAAIHADGSLWTFVLLPPGFRCSGRAPMPAPRQLAGYVAMWPPGGWGLEVYGSADA